MVNDNDIQISTRQDDAYSIAHHHGVAGFPGSLLHGLPTKTAATLDAAYYDCPRSAVASDLAVEPVYCARADADCSPAKLAAFKLDAVQTDERPSSIACVDGDDLNAVEKRCQLAGHWLAVRETTGWQ